MDTIYFFEPPFPNQAKSDIKIGDIAYLHTNDSEHWQFGHCSSVKILQIDPFQKIAIFEIINENIKGEGKGYVWKIKPPSSKTLTKDDKKPYYLPFSYFYKDAQSCRAANMAAFLYHLFSYSHQIIQSDTAFSSKNNQTITFL